MDPAIVHDNDRTGPGEHIHLIQETTNESFEPLRIVGAFNDIQSDDSVESHCREDRVPTAV